jgi:c(7)-type cytochrome triheme protein
MAVWFRGVCVLGAGAVAWAVWVGSASPMPNTVRIPPVESRPKDSPIPSALFRHDTHGQFNCYACHPSLFPRHPKGFTHTEMNGGAYCGACHDGSAAFAVRDVKCEACHVAR